MGHLGADPEKGYTNSGTAFARLRIATSEKTKTGEFTTWHKVTVWGNWAENLNASKGDLVYVEGSIRTNEWTDKEGNPRKSNEINGRICFDLGSRGGAAHSRRVEAQEPPMPSAQADFGDDDMPF